MQDPLVAGIGRNMGRKVPAANPFQNPLSFRAYSSPFYLTGLILNDNKSIQETVEMKRINFVLLLILLFTACQAQPAPASPVPTDTPSVHATSKPASLGKSTGTPAAPIAATSPAQPAVHSSSSDPNAVNLVVVRDQPIVNDSLTIDSITAAQSGWIVLYLDKEGSPAHYICYLPIPAGKSKQFVIPLNQSSNIIVNPATLSGRQIDAVIQAGAKAPGKSVNENGRIVLARFTVTSTIKP
jgi:hypothetical protein